MNNLFQGYQLLNYQLLKAGEFPLCGKTFLQGETFTHVQGGLTVP